MFQSQVGDADFKYQEEYGGVVRIKGAFGVSFFHAYQPVFAERISQEDRLLISDPKALQYILHTSGKKARVYQLIVLIFEGYNFLKWPERTEISRVLMGRGLLWADGETHRRQRKVMLPGFGGNSVILVRLCFAF